MKMILEIKGMPCEDLEQMKVFFKKLVQDFEEQQKEMGHFQT